MMRGAQTARSVPTNIHRSKVPPEEASGAVREAELCTDPEACLLVSSEEEERSQEDRALRGGELSLGPPSGLSASVPPQRLFKIRYLFKNVQVCDGFVSSGAAPTREGGAQGGRWVIWAITAQLWRRRRSSAASRRGRWARGGGGSPPGRRCAASTAAPRSPWTAAC